MSVLSEKSSALQCNALLDPLPVALSYGCARLDVLDYVFAALPLKRAFLALFGRSQIRLQIVLRRLHGFILEQLLVELLIGRVALLLRDDVAPLVRVVQEVQGLLDRPSLLILAREDVTEGGPLQVLEVHHLRVVQACKDVHILAPLINSISLHK